MRRYILIYIYTYKETGNGKNPGVEKEMIDVRQFVFVADLDVRQTQLKLNSIRLNLKYCDSHRRRRDDDRCYCHDCN